MQTLTDNVDQYLDDNPELAQTVREIEWLAAEHQRLVAEGRTPAAWLVGLHNGYSANH